MGKDYESHIPLHHIDWKPPDFSSLSYQHYRGQQNSLSSYVNPSTNMVAETSDVPAGCAFHQLPWPLGDLAKPPRGFLHGFPCYRENVASSPSAVFGEKLPTIPNEYCKQFITPNVGSGVTEKGFLVFDQTGNRTTLVFSSGVGAPFHCPTFCSPKSVCAYGLNEKATQLAVNGLLDNSGPVLTDEVNDKHGTDVQSEMHEDTEELNALLYSDDEDDDDSDSKQDCGNDNEVASTGHFPSRMTADHKLDLFEEVASSDEGPCKRQKLYCGAYNVTSSATGANSIGKRSCDYQDDAESSCAHANYSGSKELGPLSGTKRTRKEKMQEMISTLRSIIPGRNNNDAIGVLDEAIQYLKSLRHNAKALGLDSI